MVPTNKNERIKDGAAMIYTFIQLGLAIT